MVAMTATELAATDEGAEIMRRELARRRFLNYCQFMKADYVVEDAHRQIAERLEAIERGELKRLMIFMPPQHGKTLTASEMFPCWMLGKHPRLNIVFTSYAAERALQVSREARDLFLSQEQAQVFPHVHHRPGREGQRVVLAERQAAQEWGTSQRGSYYAVGVQGALTGRRADGIIIDDPHKGPVDADSPTERDKVFRWYKTVADTRLTEDGWIILIQTRWNQDDLGGRLLEEMHSGGEQWEVVSLPAISVDDDGSERALCPSLHSLKELQAKRLRNTERDWSALYQQNPVPDSGLIFDGNWWKDQNRYDPTDKAMITRCVSRVISFDTAEEDSSRNDYTAMTVGELSPQYKLAVREVWRARVRFTDLLASVIGHARRHNKDKKLTSILIENASSGRQLIQTLRAQASDDIARLVMPIPAVQGNNPHTRARTASVWCCNGCVLLPHPCDEVPWLNEFEREMFNYPAAPHDDQTASFSQLVWYWRHYLSAGLGTKLV